MEARTKMLEEILRILNMENKRKTNPNEMYEHIEKRISNLILGRDWDSIFEVFGEVLDILEKERDRVRFLCDAYTRYYKEKKDGTNVLSSEERSAGRRAYGPLRELGISDSQARYQAEGRERGYDIGTTVGESIARWTADFHMEFLQSFDEFYGFDTELWKDAKLSGAPIMDPSDVQKWVKPYGRALRANIEALPFILDDTINQSLAASAVTLMLRYLLVELSTIR